MIDAVLEALCLRTLRTEQLRSDDTMFASRQNPVENSNQAVISTHANESRLAYQNSSHDDEILLRRARL